MRVPAETRSPAYQGGCSRCSSPTPEPKVDPAQPAASAMENAARNLHGVEGRCSKVMIGVGCGVMAPAKNIAGMASQKPRRAFPDRATDCHRSVPTFHLAKEH